MAVATKLPYDKTYVEEYSQERNEPQWMKERRLKALEKAETLDMPDPDKTKIKRWNFSRFKHTAETGEVISSLRDMPDELQVLFDQENISENLLIQRNHSVAYSTLSETLREQGVIFTDIFTAMNEHSHLVQKYYMTDGVHIDEHRMTALHAALMNGGVFIYVPKNVDVKEPLQTVFWQEDPETAYFNHVLVVVDDNSTLTYLENYISHNEDQETVGNIVTEVFANNNAQVTYGAVDNFAKGTTNYINRRGVAGNDASIEWALGQMNDGNTVSENETHLVGNNATTHPKAVVVGRGRQIENFATNTVHHGMDTHSHILQHGVMTQKSTSIFNAVGNIKKGASGTYANQESRVLMLSEKARGDANPILLIDEDDVEAGHAASVGRVDELQLYYMMSRGITRKEAERLIIHGFLAPVVGQLPVESVRKQLTDLIERKIQ